MNQYHIRIDGEQSTDSYTYQELVDMGLFELDAESMNGIDVRKTTNPDFLPLKSYCFPERQSSESSYYIDEYGQIVRPNYSGSTSSSFSNSASASSSSSSVSSSGNPSGSNGWAKFWQIIITIIVWVALFGLAVAISVATSGYGIPIIAGIIYGLRSIWNER